MLDEVEIGLGTGCNDFHLVRRGIFLYALSYSMNIGNFNVGRQPTSYGKGRACSDFKTGC